MRPIFYIGFILFMLTSCSGEHAVEPVVEPAEQTVVEPVLRPEDRPSVPVEGVMGCMANYLEANRSATRAWTVPTGYVRYESAVDPISVFFAREPDEPGETEESDAYKTDMEEEFFFFSSGNWRVSKTNLKTRSYYLYGYVPHYLSVIPSIERLDDPENPGSKLTYDKGAVLTLRDLPTTATSDICVVVGAKNGIDADNDGGLTRGDFEYIGKPTEGDGTGNFAYLLFDHLYASLDIQMKVYGDYDKLRTIVLKELHMMSSVGETPIKKSMDVTITLDKTTEGADPIRSIVFSPTEGITESADLNIVPESVTEGVRLETTPKTFIGYFMPQGVTRLVLTSKYDVYDKKNNLVRANCTATNTLILGKLFDYQDSAKRGWKYIITLTIQPTYLYVMSDPDLNNPTVTLD